MQLALQAGAACLLWLAGRLGGRSARDLVEVDGDRGRWSLPGPVPAGWYLCGVCCTLPSPRASASVWLRGTQGDASAPAHRLPMRDGRPAMRVLHLQDASAFELEPGPPEARVRGFALWRAPRLLLRWLVQRRLRLRHPSYIGLSHAQLWRRPFDALWRDYRTLLDDAGGTRVRYAEWIALREATAAPAVRAGGPLLSVLMPVCDPPLAHLHAAIDSVRAQTYKRWELCIAGDASRRPEVRDLLQACAMQDPRIKLALREHDSPVWAAGNSALALATGEFVVPLDPDDLLAPHALQALAAAVQHAPGAAILYSDEDRIDAAGERSEPHFKSAWNPDLLLSHDYLSHLNACRTTLVREVGGWRPGYEGGEGHDLLLRCSARVAAEDIVHLPDVLYHRRSGEPASAAADAGLRALRDHLGRHHPGARAEHGRSPLTYRVHWPLPDPAPRVSILIPTRDRLELIRTAVESVLTRTTYPDYELLILDNQSAEPETLAWFERIAAQDDRVRVLRWDQPFNYSAINNFGARAARGSVLALVNNDIEVISPDWLGEMVAHALRPEIGCVGAKLYYPDGSIQHAGVVLGIGGVAGHAHKHAPHDAPGYHHRLDVVHDVSAVTGACLVLRRAVFEQVGGLDEQHFKVAFNDVDLCLKVRQAGWRNLWTPHAELIHHESVSRGRDDSLEKRARFESEKQAMRARWGWLLADDPYYSPHLTRTAEDHSMAPPRPGSWLPRTDRRLPPR